MMQKSKVNSNIKKGDLQPMNRLMTKVLALLIEGCTLTYGTWATIHRINPP